MPVYGGNGMSCCAPGNDQNALEAKRRKSTTNSVFLRNKENAINNIYALKNIIEIQKPFVKLVEKLKNIYAPPERDTTIFNNVTHFNNPIKNIPLPPTIDGEYASFHNDEIQHNIQSRAEQIEKFVQECENIIQLKIFDQAIFYQENKWAKQVDESLTESNKILQTYYNEREIDKVKAASTLCEQLFNTTGENAYNKSYIVQLQYSILNIMLQIISDSQVPIFGVTYIAEIKNYFRIIQENLSKISEEISDITDNQGKETLGHITSKINILEEMKNKILDDIINKIDNQSDIENCKKYIIQQVNNMIISIEKDKEKIRICNQIENLVNKSTNLTKLHANIRKMIDEYLPTLQENTDEFNKIYLEEEKNEERKENKKKHNKTKK